MVDLRKSENTSAKAMALNLVAWTDSSVKSLGVQTFHDEALWWRHRGGSQIYLSAIVTDPEATDDAFRTDLRRVEIEWGTDEISLWDCWAARDFSGMGLKRGWVEPWYLRHPSPLLPDFSLAAGLSIEAVTNPEGLVEFEESSWRGFEMLDAGRTVGRFGQHAERSLDDGGMHYLIARLKGLAVASAIAYATADMLGIYGISTIPQFRRRGYATALVRAAVALRKDLPVSVQPTSESARMYTDLGFVMAGQIAAWHKGK